MRTGYDILVSLQIMHDYFKDMVYEDFELVPELKTEEQLHQLKLLTRKIKNKWYLLYCSEGPWAKNKSDYAETEFCFSIKIKDDSFYSVTENIYLPGKGELMFFGTKIDSSMMPERREVFPADFDYEIRHSSRPVHIEVSKFKGSKVKSVTLVDPDIKKYEIDLRDQGNGVYNLSEDTIPSNDSKLLKLIVKNEDGESSYGVVYFKIIQSTDPSSNLYQINFQKKTSNNINNN